jgi:hypothetical protein
MDKYHQDWFKAITGYVAANRLVLFQILCQTYLLCKFVHCCIYIVSSGMHVYVALKFIFSLGPEMS